MRALYWTIGVIVMPLSFVMMVASNPWIRGDSGFREAFARAQIIAYSTALEAYRKDVGDYPSTSQGLQALRVNPGAVGWNGPYLQKDLEPDPWEKGYRYSRTGPIPEIASLGLQAAVPVEHRLPSLRATIFFASAIVFFGYPFLPTMLRRLHSIH